jgi:hypothetical protein
VCAGAAPTREKSVSLASCDKQQASVALERQQRNADSLFDLRGRTHSEQ